VRANIISLLGEPNRYCRVHGRSLWPSRSELPLLAPSVLSFLRSSSRLPDRGWIAHLARAYSPCDGAQDVFVCAAHRVVEAARRLPAVV
jgi:hypothetical protein